MRTKNNLLISLLLIAISVMGLCSCSTVDDGSYVDPIRLYEKIGGKWVLNRVTQTDETNAKTMVLTSLLDFDTFVIHLDQDSKGEPTTFSVEGNAPELLPVKGTWTMDNPFVKSDGMASQLLLKSESGEQPLTITTVPGANKTLEFKLIRQVNGKPFVSYTYNLMQAE